MTRRSIHQVLALSTTAVSQLLFATALIVLPQWRDQRSAARGTVTFFINERGDVRLWNRPIDARIVSGILRRAEEINPRTSVRVNLSSGVPIWPRQLGEKPTAAQFREVSKQDLEGRSVQELNQQSFATGEDVFRFLRLGDRLLILKQTAQL